MFIALLLLALCLLAAWAAHDSRDRPVRSREEELASYGMTWQPDDDPLAHKLATELRAAHRESRRP